MTSSLDTRLRHETPEGIDLELDLAGPLVRGLAWGFDAGLRLVVYFLLFMVIAFTAGAATGPVLIAIFLLEWFYPVLFEKLRGATPGKMIFGLEVLQDDGAPLSWTGALIRNLLRTADFLPLFNGLGLVTILIHPRFQRLGDIAASTVVVYRHREVRLFKIAKAPSRPTAVPLRMEEQRLLLDYCERSAELSKERRQELVSLLPNLVGKVQQEERLLSLANWFLRGKGR